MITETPPALPEEKRALDRRRRSPVLFAILAAMVLLVAGLVWALLPSGSAALPSPDMPVAKAPAPEPPTKTLTDGPELFRWAFWKKATAGDNILHAERREWGEGEGLKKWQWFLVVEPSPELLKYLREENAFGLTAAKPIPAAEGTPDWFVFNEAEVETMRARTGSMRVSFHRSKPLIYATASGAGFTPGAKEAIAKPSQPANPEIAGRLPRTSPPTSQ